MFVTKYLANSLFKIISFLSFLSFVSLFLISFVSTENKTVFYNYNNNNNRNKSKNLIQNYFKNLINKNETQMEVKYFFNAFNDSNHLNNNSLSYVSYNKDSNITQLNPSLILSDLLEISDSSDGNTTTSESRTLSSWLGLKRFRRPHYKLRPMMPSIQTRRPQTQRVHPFITTQIFPNFLTRPQGFPGPHDPQSLLLPPSLYEDSGIKYWLQFIENGGNDDDSNPNEHNSQPFAHQENSWKRRPKPPSTPINIGEKPNDEKDDELSDENDESIEQNEGNDDIKSSGSSSSNKKHMFDTTPRCDKFTSDICVDDFEYPEQAIVDEIYKRKDIFELMYSEVRDNVPLVDGIPRDVEESYSYDYYYNDNKDPQTSSTEFGDSEGKHSPRRGFVCPTEVLYGKPKLARNKRGEWKVIVNAQEFTQTVRMEKCLKPNSNCNYISYPDFVSRCAQVHSFHRLLVFEKGKGFYIDTFRIPTACTCYVNKRITYKPINSVSEEEKFNKQKTPPALSNTLWSILGGNLPNADSESLTPTQEIMRNQINLLQHLKHFPQLAHISPENVFQQLMDLQSGAQAIPQKNFEAQQNAASLELQQSLPEFTQSGIDYVLPALVVNENQNNGQQIQSQNSHQMRPIAQIHHSSGATTLLNPNANGAPLVQVIHVPVTSAIAPHPDPVPVYKEKPNQSYPEYNYLDANTLYYKRPNSAQLLQNIGEELPISVDSFKPMLLEMSSKTNSSLMSPNYAKEDNKRESDSNSKTKNINDSVTDEVTKKRKATVQSTLNKKINFSYHPILEYISK